MIYLLAILAQILQRLTGGRDNLNIGVLETSGNVLEYVWNVRGVSVDPFGIAGNDQ